MQHILRALLALAFVEVAVALTACSGGTGAVPGAPNPAMGNGGSPQTTQLISHALSWPRPGPAQRVCGDVDPGFARCVAWIRTDIPGHLATPSFTPSGYGPSSLRTAYNLTTSGGSGATVAIVDAFNDPNAESDLTVYRSQFGLPACTTTNGCFTKVQFGKRTNTGWAEEESLDVDMASAICPNCHILLVEAASNSTANLTTAEQYATAHAHFVSNSWSGSEGSTSFDSSYNVAGVAITAATGDSGFNATAQWPAILPSVTGVGGTSLTSVSPRVESAWSGAGSGCSKIYATPSFQSGINTGCSKRAQADVSADADPNTGVAVYDEHDTVNDTFERFYLRVTNPLGSVVTFEKQKWTVVGVVNSVQENDQLRYTVPVSFYPEIYIAVAQFPEGLFEMASHWFSPVWLVRATREDPALPQAMQKALASVDPTLPFAEFRTIDAIRAKTLGPQRYRAWVVSAVSGLAVILAALGVYGLVAQSVTRRTREMGIRMALGATVARIIQICTAPAIAVACAGVVFGLAGAAFAATLLKDVVWNVSPFDPTTYVLVAVLLIGLACVASLLPAMRLRHVNPARILQGE